MYQKVAVITGASRGVGKELATYLSTIGYYVVLLARDKAALDKVCNSILMDGGLAASFELDVSDSSKVNLCINQIINEYGKIDLLVNNAAVLKRGTTELPDDEIEDLLKINLNGAIYVAKHVATQMKKQKNGYIINVSSLGGKVAASFAGVYAASKFGLSGFSEALTKEMSLHDVKVTNICPSMIATEMATGRKFQLDQMIQISDIIKSVDYLLSLSKNAIPTEILISCMPLIQKTTELMQKLYLS
jgi:short-subunit dehydrogenase